MEVKVQPKASANRIEKVEQGRLKVRVTVPPEAGKANKVVIGLLSKKLKVPKSSIEILRGKSSRVKLIYIDGISLNGLSRKLDVKVAQSP